MTKLYKIATKIKDNPILFLLFCSFVLLLWAGVDQIYHQDEWTSITIAMGVGTTPHPPLAIGLLKIGGNLLGFDKVRVVAAILSILNFFLVYIVAKKITKSKNVGLWAVFLFTFSAYSIIAGLQTDLVDGTLVPLFILVTYYAYLRQSEKNNNLWRIIFFLGIIGGLLTKLSFVLFLGALALDRFLTIYELNRNKLGKLEDLRKTIWQFIKWSIPIVIVMAVFYLFFSIFRHRVVDYALHYNSLNFLSRKYLDLGFKIMKSLVWLSPLVFLPTAYAFLRKDLRSKFRLLFSYLIINLLFYAVLFDFSTFAIERYFMFMIVSCSIISAAVLSEFAKEYSIKKNIIPIFTLTSIFAALSYFLLTASYKILPLDPKVEYFNHIKNFDINFFIPLMGGSGPIGFYLPAKWILLMWLISLAVLGGAIFSKKYRVIFVTFFIVFGVGYNTIVLQEYLFGKMYGSPANIARETVDYIINNPAIDTVITYYDTGTYDLRVANKYTARFYTTATRDYSERLTLWRGYYMIVNFPEISKEHKYWKLIERCPVIKSFNDKKINSYIFDCSSIPPPVK
jgi:4-amino-4-deoxy-L-arabinose transferase-like glycosyltransferase